MQELHEQAAREFDFQGNILEVRPFGSGHINDTYRVICSAPRRPIRYLLQRLNTDVFQRPRDVMENILRVTQHIAARLGPDADPRRVLTVVPAKDGSTHFEDPQGGFWRAFHFIENAHAFDSLTSPRQAFEAARMFGDFQKALADMPHPPLHETIPLFHDGPRRLRDFEKALRDDPCARAAGAAPEIDQVLECADDFTTLSTLVENGEIPTRVTHNDTKINNVLFDDATEQGLCVIDLDTVMPGLTLYDFGDLVRTTIGPADEDEPNLEKVTIEIERFEAVLRGYLSAAAEFLHPAERHRLVFAARLMTLLNACRFLTDHLQGDHYFKVHRPNHNLQRSRVQLKLIRLMAQRQDEMHALVEKA